MKMRSEKLFLSVIFALSRDDRGAVMFTPVAGRVQVGGDFAFEA
jgi:hypothetical protein